MTTAISAREPIATPSALPVGGESRFLLKPISWAGYLQLLDEVGNDGPRMAYLDGMVKLIAPDFLHEDWTFTIGRMISDLLVGLGIPARALRSSTFTRASVAKGIEADECFYLTKLEQLRGHKKGNLDILPPPDLMLEVEITSPLINKLKLYSGLGVPELWRHDGRQLTILLLQTDGSYQPSEQSRAFPFLPIAAFHDQLARFDPDEVIESTIAYREWVRDVVLPLYQA